MIAGADKVPGSIPGNLSGVVSFLISGPSETRRAHCIVVFSFADVDNFMMSLSLRMAHPDRWILARRCVHTGMVLRLTLIQGMFSTILPVS